jgi:DNA uptake protein ComE-like DNA-binding protein
MTRILSLGQNNGFTVMILNLAPVRSYHLDTVSSLNFANRTKKIEIREAENEPMFKGCSRPVNAFSGSTIARQPLKPLTSATHNSNVRAASETVASDKPQKPAKAFAVYSDKPKTAANISRPAAPKRSSPLKRSSDHMSNISRPLKKPLQAMSQSAIEDMVEKKVAEALAARALDQPAPPTKDISEDVKRRLEYLEQKIEGQDDSRAEGLTFLLMAKQHQARGEDASALKMYELAREHFPQNAKLEAKIEKVKARLQEKKELSQRASAPPAPRAPVHMSLVPAHARKVRDIPSPTHASYSDTDTYEPPALNQASDSETDTDPFTHKPSKQRSKTKKQRRIKPTFAVATDIPPSTPSSTQAQAQAQTPRTKQLLTIINSRDVTQIRLLKGVGSKKAEAIVEALCAGDDEGNEEAGYRLSYIRSLAQLERLKGVGGKTVENMRLGLGPVSVGGSGVDGDGSFEF